MQTTNPFDDDKLQEECALFGIRKTEDAAAHTALGLHALQHRGQEATGIASYNGVDFRLHKQAGHVADVFANQQVIARLNGFAAIGHNRYATSGDPMMRNTQPIFADFSFGGFAIAHNGNITNAYALRQDLVRSGSIFQSTMDTETIIHLMATSRGSMIDRMVTALRLIKGAYSLVALSEDALIGVRDPMGFRPLILGRLGTAHILTSETVALDILGAEMIRTVEPGELIVISDQGIESYFPFVSTPKRFCIFEYIYFSRPDSLIDGISVYDVRKKIGAQLAKESAVNADIVVPIPDSGVPGAIGFAAEINLPFEYGIIRNHYVGRTFIEPTDEIRHLGVKLKHNANRNTIENKRVILVDDSIVRGTTSRKIVEMVRAAGAREVHLRITSPPTAHSCFYGVNTPKRDKLIAANHTLSEMQSLIGTDSLAFISLDGLYKAMGQAGRDPKQPHYCDACFTGDYPVELTDHINGKSPPQLSLLQGENL